MCFSRRDSRDDVASGRLGLLGAGPRHEGLKASATTQDRVVVTQQLYNDLLDQGLDTRHLGGARSETKAYLLTFRSQELGYL